MRSCTRSPGFARGQSNHGNPGDPSNCLMRAGRRGSPGPVQCRGERAHGEFPVPMTASPGHGGDGQGQTVTFHEPVHGFPSAVHAPDVERTEARSTTVWFRSGELNVVGVILASVASACLPADRDTRQPQPGCAAAGSIDAVRPVRDVTFKFALVRRIMCGVRALPGPTTESGTFCALPYWTCEKT